MSSFAYHVARIVFVCAQKQMSRIDASRIVAVMADKHIFGDWANMYFITDAMGVQYTTGLR